MGNFEKGKNWRRKRGKHGRKRKVQGVTRKVGTWPRRN